MDTDQEAPGRKPLDRPQTADELKFYARNYVGLAVLALLLFLPFGVLALSFSYQVKLSLPSPTLLILSSACHLQLLVS